MKIARSQIELLQQQAVTLLKANAEFKQLADCAAIITEDAKDVNGDIEKALAHMKCGVAIVLMTPSCTVNKPNMPGPHFDGVEMFVHCAESPIINRGTGTNKTASYWAERAAHALHQKTAIQGKIFTVRGMQLLADPELLVYRVMLATQFGLTDEPITQ